MPRINEATDTDLKVIERLQQLGWKRGDTLLYQQEYAQLPRSLRERAGVRGTILKFLCLSLDG
jgi:hypothetical protein